MKKWYAVFLTSLLLLLAACGTGGEDTKPTDNDTPKEEKTITAEEVYEKAMARQNEVKSFSADVILNEKISYESPDESYEGTIKSNMKMDTVIEPFGMYMKGSLSEMSQEGAQEFEAYIVGDGFYMQDPVSKQWMKLPIANFGEIMGEMGKIDASEQLEELKPFLKDFKVEETDTHYVMKLDVATDELKKYILEEMKAESGLEISEEDKDASKNVELKTINYVININKNSNDIDTMDMVFEATFEDSGEKVSIAMDSKFTFTQYNGIESISVPQEVINQAIEVSP